MTERKIENWYLATSRQLSRKKKYDIIVIPSMCNNHDLNNRIIEGESKNDFLDLRIIGDVYEGDELTGKIAEKVVTMDNETMVFTDGGYSYVLGKKHRDYKEFDQAIKDGVPVLYNYYIIELYESVYIYGDIYENGRISPFMSKIISQNFDDYTLNLSEGKKVFVAWNCMNLLLDMKMRHEQYESKEEIQYKMSRRTFFGKNVIDIFNSKQDSYFDYKFMIRSAKTIIR